METKPKRGGNRNGAGRPKRQEPIKIVSLRLEQPLYDVLAEMARRRHQHPATLMQNELRKSARVFIQECGQESKMPVIDV
jgi:hypothetical protein